MLDIILDEKDLSFNRLEKEIYAYGCQVACEVLKNVLETMDKSLQKKGINRTDINKPGKENS